MKKSIITVILTISFIMSCKTEFKKEINKPEDNWELTVRNKPVKLYTLKNKNNIEVTITNYGGKIVSLNVPDKHGKFEDVVLGYDNIKNTVEGNTYFGAIIGRFGNRIAKGKFSIDGEEYTLKTNLGNNALHGGEVGYNAVVWDAKQEGNILTLKHLDPDKNEGYPGNLNIIVTYELNDDNGLKITYEAITDKSTPVNLTNHAYFNLQGAGNGTILNHKLLIVADNYTPVDSEMIPTGDIASVKGTPFDFTTLTEMGKNINADDQQIKIGSGFDHNWVLNNQDGDLALAARVVEPESGRVMEVFTTEPGLQFYAANFLNGGDVGKSGKKYQSRASFCLETQHYPDAPNQKNFPNTILKPGEKYHTETIYKFSIQK
ncbi:MAG: galactose mutarotase [Flavobacteriaceae bacterium]|nr:galactose mutarotase [Flavobacteriaceae bacterium]